MAKDYKALIGDINQYVQQLSKANPEVLGAFSDLSGSLATEGGALSPKTREIIALAIAVSLRCDGCIGFHAKKARHLGASREEVADALGVSIVMGGGPSLMYAADALRAYDQFAG